jgi:UDP-GlcNAc:undecaprenyl-phosphate/decaprenyl-phosphate GlcNAc-1-phosphate transferase
MFIVILVIASSLLISFVLTPFCRDFFGLLGVVDKPDSHRKTHARPIPRVGGIALAISYSVALFALGFGLWKEGFSLDDPSIRLVLRLSPAVGLVFLTGFVDDLWSLPPWWKLAGQTAAAVCACWVGVRLATPSWYTGPTIVIDIVSVFWLLLCANAFNLIDGMDGLATGVGLIAAASLLITALVHHFTGLAIVITPLIGALVGFLYYNFNPASIFLGDCGSLLVGFLLGCYGLVWSQHATTGLSTLAPLVALAFPVFEVGLSVVRRFLRVRPVFGSDKNHIHDRIRSLGLSQRASALVLYGVCGLAALLAVLQTILRPQLATILLLLALGLAYAGFRSLQYHEFSVLREFLFAGEFRRALRGRIHLHEYEESLAAADTIDQCWAALRHACREANLSYVSLTIDGRLLEDGLRAASSPDGRVSFALWGSNAATFGYDPSSSGSLAVVVTLAERLQKKLKNGQIIPWPVVEAEPAERLKVNSAATG